MGPQEILPAHENNEQSRPVEQLYCRQIAAAAENLTGSNREKACNRAAVVNTRFVTLRESGTAAIESCRAQSCCAGSSLATCTPGSVVLAVSPLCQGGRLSKSLLSGGRGKLAWRQPNRHAGTLEHDMNCPRWCTHPGLGHAVAQHREAGVARHADSKDAKGLDDAPSKDVVPSWWLQHTHNPVRHRQAARKVYSV